MAESSVLFNLVERIFLILVLILVLCVSLLGGAFSIAICEGDDVTRIGCGDWEVMMMF